MADFIEDKKKHYPSSQQQEIQQQVNDYTDRAAAQEAVNSQATVGATTPNAEVADFAAGKAGGNTPVSTQPAGETPVTGQPADATPVVDNGQQNGTTPVVDPNNAVKPEDYTFTEEQLKDAGQHIDEQQQQAIEESPSYLTDWSKVDNIYEAAKKLNVPLSKVLQDYQRWGAETGNPTSWMDGQLMDKDLSKTAAENEEAIKKAERKEKFDKVGNFLLHLGNAIGNVAGGGYASMKLEDPVQWSERQRLIKEKTLEQRRKNNESIWGKMQTERANQRRLDLEKQKDKTANRKLDIAEAESKRKAYYDDFKMKMALKTFDYKKEKDELDRKLKERQITAREHAIAIQGLNAATNNFRAHSDVVDEKEVINPVTGQKEKLKNVKSRVASGSVPAQTPKPAATTPESRAAAQNKWAKNKVRK